MPDCRILLRQEPATRAGRGKTYLDDVLTDYAALAAAYPEAKDRFVEAPPRRSFPGPMMDQATTPVRS